MTGSLTMRSERTFQIWEYQVSHGQLLIRSPKAPATTSSPEFATNIDLVCLGVDYMAVPAILHGLELAEATPDEVQSLEPLLGRVVLPKKVRMLVSQGRRFPIVAVSFDISENDWDIFESPFEFRSRFRSNA